MKGSGITDVKFAVKNMCGPGEWLCDSSREQT